MKKPDLVILDANVVIDAHRENYWNPLIQGHKIHLPATVVREEVQYFDAGKNNKKGIQLKSLIDNGLIFEIAATLDDEKHLQRLVKPHFLQSFDPGEREALALLITNRYKDFLFCTGDRAAIKGLGVLGLSNRGISVEKLLEKIGIKKNLKNHFTENWLRQQLTQGFQERDLWGCQ